MDDIATLETLRAAWEKRAYQAEANENRYREALEELSKLNFTDEINMRIINKALSGGVDHA